jgi:outer membrane lipoprotein-sorting protein
MKTITMAVAVLVASMFMSACGKKETVAPAETAPAATPATAEAAPAATSGAESNTEDGSQTSGDKVSPKP